MYLRHQQIRLAPVRQYKIKLTYCHTELLHKYVSNERKMIW